MNAFMLLPSALARETKPFLTMPLTWRAGESIAVKTRLALAGEGSLRVVAHSILMASARLALVNVLRRENKRGLSREMNSCPKLK